MPSTVEEGILVGLLIGEGHFGGDGKQPQVTLRMHERRRTLFLWIERVFPGGRLYGPYEHGGRRYYQWMARGPFLRDELVPLLRRALVPTLDRYAYERFLAMCERYARKLEPLRPDAGSPGVPDGALTRDPPDHPEEVPPDDAPNDARGPRAARIFATLRETGVLAKNDAEHVQE